MNIVSYGVIAYIILRYIDIYDMGIKLWKLV